MDDAEREIERVFAEGEQELGLDSARERERKTESVTEPEADRLFARLQAQNQPSILRSRGRVYGSRNLLEVFPEAIGLVNRSPLGAYVTDILGRNAGIVRALYFEKPPDRSWSLPWHRDRTIAVKRNDVRSSSFHKPTIKAGVPHVEAPTELCAAMLALRIHLDVMTESDGPLCVIPGSHEKDDTSHQMFVELHASVGDVLLMKPLILHSSRMSHPGATSHRRVIHIEAAGIVKLPDGYEWHTFIPVTSCSHGDTHI